MKIQRQHLHSLGFSFMVTAFLFMLLILVDGILFSPIQEPSRRGSIKLSAYKHKPAQQEESSAEDVPEVAELEKMAKVDMPMETPTMQMAMPTMSFNFTPEVAGTVSVAGVPSVSAAAPAPSQASGGALSLGDVDELPRPIYAPPPQYPSTVKKRTKVTVRVRVLLGTNGKVISVNPVNANAEHAVFLDEIRNSVLRWEFTPCKKAGQAVQCVAEQPFVFNPQ